MQKEIWKDIPGYEGDYQASIFGRIKSLKRYRSNTDIIRRLSRNDNGYLSICLTKNNYDITFRVHQLIAMAFLGHKPDGYKLVVDHKDNNKLNNHVYNLQLISQRENSSKDRWRYEYSSKYVGVCWDKKRSMWTSYILIDNEKVFIGAFEIHDVAKLWYEDAVKCYLFNLPIKLKRTKFSSKYYHVTYDNNRRLWSSRLSINGINKSYGRYKTEIQASMSLPEGYRLIVRKNYYDKHLL